MELQLAEEYEDIVVEWQRQLVQLLKAKLKEHGIENDTARNIVGEFMFDMSMLHDQEEIKVNGKFYGPRISFDDFSGNLIATDKETNLHEFAYEYTNSAFSN